MTINTEEQFCGRCLTGVDSDEHHEKCVVTGRAEDGKPARPYVLRSSAVVGEAHAGVRVDEVGNFMAMTQGHPKSLSILLRMIADQIDYNIEHEGGNR